MANRLDSYRHLCNESFRDNLNWLESNLSLLTPSQIDVLEKCKNSKEVWIKKEVLWAHALRFLVDLNYRDRTAKKLLTDSEKNKDIKNQLIESYKEAIYDLRYDNAIVVFERTF